MVGTNNFDVLFHSSPVGNFLFVACDGKYWQEYGPAFCMSASDHAKNVHVHLINPVDKDIKLAEDLDDKLSITVTMSSESSGEYCDALKYAGPDALRSYYASSRFHVLPILLGLPNVEGILTLDIDSLIVKDFEWPFAELGLFLRPNEPQAAMKIAAGAVWTEPEARHFALQVSERIRNGPNLWFVDQVSLLAVFNESPYRHEASSLTFEDFGQGTLLDWTFNEYSSIWTGKGDRKHSNKIYYTKYAEYDERWDVIGR
jgi:hypothetical protein